MAVGAYGTIIPISIANNDIASMVDITYCYHETRSYDSLSRAEFHRLDSSILTQAKREVSGDYTDEYVDGMYNLQLPLSEFNKKGFYTVYIKPKEIEAVITDVGNLTAFPNVRGLVIDTEQINNSAIRTLAKTNNELVGYRIIYISDNGTRQNYYRIITSCNKCEPVVQAPNSSSDKSYSYRYDDASSLVFVTVSPSSAPTFKDNALPYIGKPTQKILLVNTLFEPIQLDIEMTTHDADTISYMLENSQLRDLDNGLVTTFNDEDEIYMQNEHYTLKDRYSGRPIFEVKQNRRNNIDFTQTIDDK
jgi:hypothetical protein